MTLYLLTISAVPFVMVYFFRLVFLRDIKSGWKWLSLKESAVLAAVCAVSFIYLERHFQQYTHGRSFLYVFSSIIPWSIDFALYIWMLIKVFQITRIKAQFRKKSRELN
jgi:hypothetical protein